MKYTRIYNDLEGESHFEDVAVELDPVDFAPPAPPLNLATPVEAERVIFCAVESTWYGDWHPAPHRQFYFQMSGVLEVTVSDGETRQFEAGAIVLLEDLSGKGHRTRVAGDGTVHSAFIQLPAHGAVAA